MDIKNIILSQTAPIKKDCIWLKPSSDNIVDVYVYNNGSWQSTVRAVDLSDYITTSKLSEVLSGYVTTKTLSNYQTSTDNSLSTNSKQIAGAINELKTSIDDIDVSGDVQAAISQLDFSEVTVPTGNMIGAVSQTDGVINVSTRAITADDIPEIAISKVTDLSTKLDSKQDTLTAGIGIEITPKNQINVTLDTTVFKVVSVLPDSPAQGDENKIHLVPAESTGANNAYTEYVWVNSAWEILGEYTSEVDLTPYLKTVDAANTYLSKTDASSTYLSKTDASSTYLNKTDASGTYLSKTEASTTYIPETEKPTFDNYIFSRHTGDTGNVLPDGADLNNYDSSKCGYYVTNDNASYTNAPIQNFGLLVGQTNGIYAFQIVFGYYDKGVYYRSYSIGSSGSPEWRPWVNIVDYYSVNSYEILSAPFTIPALNLDRETIYIFNVGETAYSITGASGIKWAGGILPQVSPNTTIVVSVLKNLATWQTFV